MTSASRTRSSLPQASLFDDVAPAPASAA
ncbi:uracil-DNA glycosylase, partial [Paraburkholderia sp. 31.1]|nr:uracil-DNA glycosylase [Paraburkholderia sp. 31.1]